MLDATFNKEESRMEVKRKLGIPDEQFFVIECVCPENIVIPRIKKRKNDYSDADVEVYQKMKKFYESVKTNHITINTTLDIEKNVRLVRNYIGL